MARKSWVAARSLQSDRPSQRRRFLQTGMAAAVGALLPMRARADSFVPNETLVSSAPGLIDLEYSQSLAMYAMVDEIGQLWVGDIDRATGDLVQPDGKQILADTGTQTLSDVTNWIYNGPEWIATPDGDQVVYTKFAAGKRHNERNARIGLAFRAPNGQWSGGLQGPDLPRHGVFGSSTEGGIAPAIYYVDDAKMKRWRDLYGTTEEIVPGTTTGTHAMRFVEGQRAIVYRLQAAGIWQAFRYDLDTKALEQLTFDSGNKGVVWMWRAPEFGNEHVLVALVERREVRVYRKLPSGPGGALQWTVIHRVSAPRGALLGSVEVFTYAGRSYMFMQMESSYSYPHEIWFANIDSANPIWRCISESTPVKRSDPEHFITDHGPVIYFNASDPSRNRPERSLGLWRSDPGVS